VRRRNQSNHWNQWNHLGGDLGGAGQPVSAKVVTSYQGAEHCDWQSATFLSLGWPLGKKMKTIDEGRQYVRDPDGVIGG
jgi:hypothetical protein